MTYPQIASALGIIGIVLSMIFEKWLGCLIGVTVLLVVYLEGKFLQLKGRSDGHKAQSAERKD